VGLVADSAAPSPGRIFISYRREETAYPAGWLYDRLADRYGGGQIFKDVDSIELGDDFVEVITRAVGYCDVLLALIGKQWVTSIDEDGRRRLDDPDDFVRLEIEAALTRSVRVTPVRVDGARMPRPNELPPSLAMLVRRQALELSPARFDFDTNRLLKVLDKTLAEMRTAQDAEPDRPAPVARDQPQPHEQDLSLIEEPSKAPIQPKDRATAPIPLAPEPPVRGQIPVPGPTPVPTRSRSRSLVIAAAAIAAAVVVVLVVRVMVDGQDTDSTTVQTPPPTTTRPTTTAPAPPLAWRQLPNLDVPLEAAGVAALDGEVWVVGGLTPGPGLRPALRDVQIYNPAQNKWRPGPKLPLPGGLDGAAVASDGKRLYVVGGRTGQDPNRDYRAEVWVLDGPDDPDWEHLTSNPQVRDGANVVGADHPDAVPLPEPRYAGAVAWDEAGKRLVFAGGSSEPKMFEADVWEWREGGDWHRIDELTQARDDLAVATDPDGRVWFLGGNGGDGPERHLDVVDRVEGDNVKPDSDIKIPKIRASAAVWLPQRGICLLGGIIPGSPQETQTAEVVCQAGTPLPPLLSARAGMGVALLDDTIYLVGGFEPGKEGITRVDALDLQ
jgi:hypothetical protein